MSQFSKRIENLTASPIREILSVIERPGMISFAGGLPALETFPRLSIDSLPEQFLQYGESAGEECLRAKVCEQLNGLGLDCEAGQVIILSGSQQGIDLVAKLFVDADSLISVEMPTYLAALQVFKLFGASFCSNEKALANPKSVKPRLLYSIPTFQNPSGYCYTQLERENLAEYCQSKGVPLYEDDPYRELVYDSSCRTPICSFMKAGSWIYQGSFSKSYAPGLRLGFLVCSKDLITPLSRLKQAADLHSSRISQWLTMQLLADKAHDNRMNKLVSFYSKRRDDFDALLNRYMGHLATWHKPAGGLFFWLQLNRKVDVIELLSQALAHNVAFMPGDYFYPDGSAEASCLRLNFSHANADEADQGLALLAQLVENMK